MSRVTQARGLALALATILLAIPHGIVAQEKIRVVTTSTDLKSLVEAVGGERTEVESLTVPEQDPHTVEIKPTQLARLSKARLIVRIGLDHEPWFTRLPVRDVAVIDASRSVKLLQTQTPRLRAERQAHVHAFGNTHYWLDPDNAEPITATVLAALAAQDPAGAGTFARNRQAFLARLKDRIVAWEAALKDLRGTKVVVVHDSWAYFAERFGLNIVAAAEPSPGVTPSPAELAALFKRMREANVGLLIADPHTNPALVQQISERGGARSVTLLPSAADYIGLFEENVRRLSQLRNPG